jgi:hypothetical protein
MKYMWPGLELETLDSDITLEDPPLAVRLYNPGDIEGVMGYFIRSNIPPTTVYQSGLRLY